VLCSVFGDLFSPIIPFQALLFDPRLLGDVIEISLLYFQLESFSFYEEITVMNFW